LQWRWLLPLARRRKRLLLLKPLLLLLLKLLRLLLLKSLRLLLKLLRPLLLQRRLLLPSKGQQSRSVRLQGRTGIKPGQEHILSGFFVCSGQTT
jgi:hypothetical protein